MTTHLPASQDDAHTGPILDAQMLAAGPGQRRPLDPARYVADGALRRAVQVAMTLGMPLLLTGEPGTGKTQLGYRLAWELAPNRPLLRFDTKSTSVASDLFYQFDQVRHYASSQLAAVTPGAAMPEPRQSVRYRALGLAVLRTQPWAYNTALVSDRQADAEHLRGATPVRSVVLIDEVDKAPRDFPNDLLNQLESFSFDVPELEAYGLQADSALRPIVVITSNSERQLPEAFLRRCVYHHITLPQEAQARQAWIDQLLTEHFGGTPLAATPSQPGLATAAAAYWALRDMPQVAKPPSTSELLDWLHALQQAGVQWSRKLPDQAAAVRGTLGALLKTSDDLARGLALFPLPAAADSGR